MRMPILKLKKSFKILSFKKDNVIYRNKYIWIESFVR